MVLKQELKSFIKNIRTSREDFSQKRRISINLSLFQINNFIFYFICLFTHSGFVRLNQGGKQGQNISFLQCIIQC